MQITAAEAVIKYGSKAAAARALGLSRSGLQHRCRAEAAKPQKKAPATGLGFPTFPRSDLPTPEIIRRLAKEAGIKAERRNAEKWFNVSVPGNLPIGILWFGDPHLGADTNWQRLESDVAICATSPGMYGANLGDSSNNWVGRLARLYDQADVSRPTERKLIKWFLAEAGITWLVWLMGNHDEWEHGADLIRAMDVHGKVPMLDWEARFKLTFKGGKSVRVHAAHDFPGHSIYNPTHANARAVRFLGSGADLYICGHRHTFGFQQFETPETGGCPVMIRAAGYKVGDSHSRRMGFPEATQGASVLTIIDPSAGPAGRVLAFADIKQGARVLSALRGGK